MKSFSVLRNDSIEYHYLCAGDNLQKIILKSLGNFKSVYYLKKITYIFKSMNFKLTFYIMKLINMA